MTGRATLGVEPLPRFHGCGSRGKRITYGCSRTRPCGLQGNKEDYGSDPTRYPRPHHEPAGGGPASSQRDRSRDEQASEEEQGASPEEGASAMRGRDRSPPTRTASRDGKDLVVGLFVGNLLAVLSRTFLTAPIATEAARCPFAG